MLNPHMMARRALRESLGPFSSLQEAHICTDARGVEASAPLKWHTALTPEEALAQAMAGKPPMVLGRPLVAEACIRGGHACFIFTQESYAAFIAHIIAHIPKPPLPDFVRSEADYALARMLMLARKGGEAGCPADARVRAALWLAMGIPDVEGTRREARRARAARALLGLMRGRPLSERLALAASMGQAADCAARLLAYNAI